MAAQFERVEVPRDQQDLVDFLGRDLWPFHGRHHLTPDDVLAIDVASPDVESFWVVLDGHKVGLVRLVDLGDIGDGAPRFDLRIAGRHRGRGLGTEATRWVVTHLFTAHPDLHRIEADTRSDNVAMQRALTAAGFTPEGRLRQAWRIPDGRWADTLVYGILRSEWSGAPPVRDD